MSLTWEDKEVKFDIPFMEMRLKCGEKVVDRLENIEDTKGNGGDRGRLIVTNIRILWHSVASPRVNLWWQIFFHSTPTSWEPVKISVSTAISTNLLIHLVPAIGFNCMVSISTKVVNSKLRGTTQALHILTSSNKTRFEFIFTNLVPGSTRHFTSVMGVHKAYITSKLYRELKLRGAVVHNKQLKILPLEQVFSMLHGVWNLSSDQGSLGTFIVTNVRLVWFADMNEAFNISLPYLQIDSIKIRDSKFGTVLVLTSSEMSGSYVLGFRVDPEEKLVNLHKELTSLYSIYKNNPIFGVEYKWCSTKSDDSNVQNLVEDFEEIEEPKGEMSNTLAAYLADEGHLVDRPPVYSPDLGLAIESVKEGYSLQKLWEVIPP